jgi:transposase
MKVTVGGVKHLPPAAQEAIRFRAVSAVIDKGQSQAHVAEVFDVDPRSVQRWVAAWRAGGNTALKARKRGQRPEVQKHLDKSMQYQLRRTVKQRTPEDVGLHGQLWTRPLVGELITLKYGITLSKKTIGKYLRSWGLSPQRSIRRAREQNPEAIERWLEVDYPAIVARAKRQRGRVYWLDQTGLRSDAHAGTGWAPIGKAPVVDKTGQRFGVNAMCAMSNRGKLFFTVYDGSFNVAIMIEFLRRLVNTADHKVHLIVDGHPTHRAKAVTKWLKAHVSQIEMHFLPGYAPELNPVEILNGDIKKQVAKANPHHKDDLRAELRSHLRRRQQQPEFLRSLFGKPEVAYAAA